MGHRSSSGRRTALDRLRLPLRRVTRYDFVLAAIPAAYLVAGLLGSMAVVPTRAAVLGASAFGALAVLDALFLNPPPGRRPDRPPRRATG